MTIAPEPVLEDLGLDPPPCEALDHRVRPPVACGRPSVTRIKVRCQVCGAPGTAFVCRGCLERTRNGHAWCGGCGSNQVLIVGYL